jgi:Holliday junction resolvase RusA-like endonuclease
MVKLIVYGSPAPQGSKKLVGTYTDKQGRVRGMMAEASAKVKPWRQDVKSAAEAHRLLNGVARLDGPILARMVFTMPKPKSAPKRRRTFPATKPDLSKLIRSTEDALTDSGLIADDARIVEYSRAAKVYPGEDPEALDAPGVRITLALLVSEVQTSAPASDLFSREASCA